MSELQKTKDNLNIQMSNQVLQMFSTLKCHSHQQVDIVQVCVSSKCTQNNRLCCLQCVDEKHCGQDHILISLKKFVIFLEEFHAVLQQKEELNKKLFQNLQIQNVNINANIRKYFQFIQESLKKENQISSYQQISQIDYKTVGEQQLRRKINQVIQDHSWILELNLKSLKGQSMHGTDEKGTEQQKAIQISKEALRSKYGKLQKKINEITENSQNQIFHIIQKRKAQIKKLFHHFDEIKYKIEDDGWQLQKNVSKSLTLQNHLQATPQESPLGNYQNGQVSKKQATSYFDTL